VLKKIFFRGFGLTSRWGGGGVSYNYISWGIMESKTEVLCSSLLLFYGGNAKFTERLRLEEERVFSCFVNITFPYCAVSVCVRVCVLPCVVVEVQVEPIWLQVAWQGEL